MRVFEPHNAKYRFNHPDDMKKIIDYLERNGKVNIDKQQLEDLYYDYSDSVCCGWRCVDDESLEQFAEYLYNLEVYPNGFRKINTYSYLDD